MTLFHQETGQVRVKGVESTTNVVLHSVLKQELTHIVNALSRESPSLSPELILSGSWLNMAESMQRIPTRRILDGQHPETPQQIIHRLETVAKVWNQQPTPFQWGGKRAERRQRARLRRQHHRLGGSGACTESVLPFQSTSSNGTIHAN